MRQVKHLVKISFISLCSIGLFACAPASQQATTDADSSTPDLAQAQPQKPAPQQTCQLVESGFGTTGKVNVRAEEVVSGLDVPWGIAFLPNKDLLVTERPGRLRLVRNGQLQPEPVTTIAVTARGGEGGLLGIALHPQFAKNRLFYLYYTADREGTSTNRVERWRLSPNGQQATRDRMILDNIPVAAYHNGGRLRFGPDGMLYIGTGDARTPGTSQTADSLAGKILRVTPDGKIPPDNPIPGNPAFISGIRNTQGFDWRDRNTLLVTDHGPSGELGRTGRDEVTVAKAGDNLGWSTIYGCQTQAGLVTPSISWVTAVPPGGAAIYTGKSIPEWQGSLIIGTLGSRHLHRIAFAPNNPARVQLNEVYLQGTQGRLREVIMSPQGELYVTTSNCDSRGVCPPDRDKILRITR
jgi:aldose sugar dehydrogenase